MPYPSDTLYPGETLWPGTGAGYECQSIIGQELVDALYWLPGDPYWLPAYLDAIGALFQQTAAVTNDTATDGDPSYQTGYGSIFTINPRFDGDTAICPTTQLPYVGQFVGVTVPPDADDQTARSLITSEQGLARGSSSAIDTAASRFLTSAQHLTHLSRETPTGMASAFYFTLVVEPEGVIDPVGLVAAVNAVKPAWQQWALVQVNGTPWDADAAQWHTDMNTWSSGS